MTDTDNATPDGDTPHTRGSRISFGVRANLVAGVLTIIPSSPCGSCSTCCSTC